MQRVTIFVAISFCVLLLALTSFAQSSAPKGLVGRWEGTAHSGHGDQNIVGTFQQENDQYVGSMTGLDGVSRRLKNVKLEGNTVTAESELETPNGTIKLTYALTLKDDTLNGIILGSGGHNFEIDIKLKRVAAK